MLQELNKTVYRNLLHIYGIGPQKAISICETIGISKSTKLLNLTPNKKEALITIIATLKKSNPGLDSELKLYNAQNVKRLIKINSYRRKTT